jgi:selenium metabolism protein YedF
MGLKKDTLVILKSSELGEGVPDLGEKLLQAFLKMLSESGTIPAKIICMNSGIFLTTEGSPVIEIMNKFEKDGAEILSCGTCLDYYGRKDKLIIGQPTNMKDTVQAMLTFARVVAP